MAVETFVDVYLHSGQKMKFAKVKRNTSKLRLLLSLVNEIPAIKNKNNDLDIWPRWYVYLPLLQLEAKSRYPVFASFSVWSAEPGKLVYGKRQVSDSS